MAAPEDRWLTVWVRDLPLAIPLSQVRQVLLWVPWRRALPREGGGAGVLSLRGEDWPVWDLGSFWGLRPRRPDVETGFVLIDRPDGARFGALLVDRVGWVVEAAPEESLGRVWLPGLPFRRTITDGETGTEHFVMTVVDLLDRLAVTSAGA